MAGIGAIAVIEGCTDGDGGAVSGDGDAISEVIVNSLPIDIGTELLPIAV